MLMSMDGGGSPRSQSHEGGGGDDINGFIYVWMRRRRGLPFNSYWDYWTKNEACSYDKLYK